MNNNKLPARVENMTAVQQAFSALGVSAANLVRSLGEFIQAAVATLNLKPWQEVCTWYLAYNWAKQARPKWVAIMERTKKRRVRKKYRNRILREYKEASQ